MVVALPITQTNPALKNSVGVAEVTGGRETNAMWTSQVSSDAFKRAIEQSLENAGMFSKIVAGGKYQLTFSYSFFRRSLLNSGSSSTRSWS